MAYFIEAIHVKLPNKGGKVAMFEIFGENSVCESVDVFYIEWVFGESPVDIVWTGFILGYRKITSRIVQSLSIKEGMILDAVDFLFLPIFIRFLLKYYNSLKH